MAVFPTSLPTGPDRYRNGSCQEIPCRVENPEEEAEPHGPLRLHPELQE